MSSEAVLRRESQLLQETYFFLYKQAKMRRQDYNPVGVNLSGNCSGFPNNFIIEVRHKFSSEIVRNADFRSGWIDFGFNLG